MERIPAVAARQRLGALVDEVEIRGAEHVIERDRRPTAVVVPLEAHQRYGAARDAPSDRVEAVRERLAQGVPASDLERWIDRASGEARSSPE